VNGLTYDAGALVAAERSDRRMWALHAEAIDDDLTPVVPAAVLAQAWRGGRGKQANLARLLAFCDVEPMSEEQSKAVGVLAGKAGHDDIVDVAVVEGAIRRGDGVVTSDEAHIRSIASAAGTNLKIRQV
jgi:hypothetical protein